MNHKELVEATIRYESGNMTDVEEIEFFQHLVDTGMAWTLQGSYGRRATQLINEGLVSENKGIDSET